MCIELTATWILEKDNLVIESLDQTIEYAIPLQVGLVV